MTFLQVYEHGFSPVKVPKHALNGSNMLLMGFPDCGSSYFLLMQHEDDFRPIFKLLETQPDPSGKPESSGVLNLVSRIKNVDINQMHMLEGEPNLSLLDYNTLTFSTNDAGSTNQTSDHGLLSDLSVEHSLSGFSSIVDEIFEQERRSSAPAFSVQSYNQDNSVKLASVGSNWNGSLYPMSNYKGRTQSVSTSSITSASGRSTSVKKITSSKSDQDLASRSPLSAASARSNAFRKSVTGTQGGSFKDSRSTIFNLHFTIEVVVSIRLLMNGSMGL